MCRSQVLPSRCTNYRFVDAGFQTVDVENYQARAPGRSARRMARLRLGDGAAVFRGRGDRHLPRRQHDRAPGQRWPCPRRMPTTRSTAAASPTTSFGDCTPSSQVAIDAIIFRPDARVAHHPDPVGLQGLAARPVQPAGRDVGVAFGVEARKRDPATTTATPIWTAPTPSATSVDRRVSSRTSSPSAPTPTPAASAPSTSAYVEFAVPVVSPEMNIPLVRSLDVQIAGRSEHYSRLRRRGQAQDRRWPGTSSTACVSGVPIRKGFRAPNLEQTNAATYAPPLDQHRLHPLRGRSAGRSDRHLRRLLAARSALRCWSSGNPGPGAGGKHQPVRRPGLPAAASCPRRWGDFTFTVDRWKIEQEKIVGLFGGRDAVVQDYLNRVQGRSNPTGHARAAQCRRHRPVRRHRHRARSV